MLYIEQLLSFEGAILELEEIGFFSRVRLFQKAAIGIMILFFGLMITVAVLAYSRPTGGTGLDMTQVQKLREKQCP